MKGLLVPARNQARWRSRCPGRVLPACYEYSARIRTTPPRSRLG